MTYLCACGQTITPSSGQVHICPGVSPAATGTTFCLSCGEVLPTGTVAHKCYQVHHSFGWQCPVCKGVFAPFMPACTHCLPQVKKD